MEFVIAQLDNLRTSHPVFFVLFMIPLATIVANAGIFFFMSSKWDDFVEAHPRWAATMKLLKAVGIDPVGILKAVYWIVTGKQWSAPGDVAKKIPPLAMLMLRTLALLALLLQLALLVGCSGFWTQARQDAAIKAGADYAVCVEDRVAAGETDAVKIALACEVASIPDEVKILVAKQSLAKAALKCGGPK